MPEISDQDYRRFVLLDQIASKYDGPEGITRKIGKLEEDAAKERQRRQDAEGKIPGDGAVVLTAEDASRWAAFRGLGKSPEELKALATGVLISKEEAQQWEAFRALNIKAEDVAAVQAERDELQQKDAARTRRDTIAVGFRAEGVDEKHIAAALRLLDGAAVELKPGKRMKGREEIDGKFLAVTLAGEGQKERTLAELATEVEEFWFLTPGTPETDAGRRQEYVADPLEGGSGRGGYDPTKEGQAMAARQKAEQGHADLALR